MTARPLSPQLARLVSNGGTLCVVDEHGSIVVVCRDCMERVYVTLTCVSAKHGPPRANELAVGCGNASVEQFNVRSQHCVVLEEYPVALSSELLRAQLVLLVDSWHFAAVGVREERDRLQRAAMH